MQKCGWLTSRHVKVSDAHLTHATPRGMAHARLQQPNPSHSRVQLELLNETQHTPLCSPSPALVHFLHH
jgi:hypothetical protein